MSYLKATKNGTEYRFSLGSASDTTSGLFPAVKTHNTANGNFSGLLSNVTLYAGRTYYVKVKFRTRGDGNSTSRKCSSVGFSTYWNNWGSYRSYIHNSATAYAEIGKIVEWTYSFTVDSDVTPQGTALYFIINNAWASGNDAQTIDLYYYKYWDSEGNVYDEKDAYNNTNSLPEPIFSIKPSVESLEENNLPSICLSKPPTLVNGRHYYLEFMYRSRGDGSSTPTHCSDLGAICVTDGVTGVNNGMSAYLLPQADNIAYNNIGKVQSRRFDFAFAYEDVKPKWIGLKAVRLDNQTFDIFYIKFYDSTGKVYNEWGGYQPITPAQYESPDFLKLTKNNNIYYSRLFKNKGRVKLTRNSLYYLEQGASCYQYSELASYTYKALTDNFEY